MIKIKCPSYASPDFHSNISVFVGGGITKCEVETCCWL